MTATIDGKIWAASIDEAKRVARGSVHFDDLVQEGVIAGWTASQGDRRDVGMYARQAARNRVRTVAAGRAPMVGSERGKNEARDPMRVPFACVPESERPEFAESSMGIQPPHPPLRFSSDIEEALAALTPRQREIAVLVADGAALNDLERKLWGSRIRPALREALAHRAPDRRFVDQELGE